MKMMNGEFEKCEVNGLVPTLPDGAATPPCLSRRRLSLVKLRKAPEFKKSGNKNEKLDKYDR